MGSIRSGTALAADYPVTNGAIQRTIDKVDKEVQNGFLSGAGLAQALTAIGTVMDTYAETAAAPTAAYTGTAGTTTRYYAALIEYPLAIDNPVRPFPYRNVNVMPGQPASGRTPNGADRTKRYSKASASVSVANTAATLVSGTAYVTVTAPAYSGSVSGVTFAIVAVDASGNLLRGVATGVAPGGTAIDSGGILYAAPGILPAHAEYAIIPAAAASGVLTVSTTGTVAAGGLVSVLVGTVTATYVPVAGDTATTIGAALATAIAAAQALVSASASAGAITVTAKATGTAGNLALAASSTNGNVFVSAPYSMLGGIAQTGVYGPRTVVSGVAGVQ